MTISSSFLLLGVCLVLVPFVASTRTLHNTRLLAPELNRELNNSRRNLGGFFSCQTGNPIDDCWRCDNNWNENRQKLAECAIGFGKDAYGGKGGEIYVVTDSSDHDAVTPKPGTLRHAVIQDEPLWIIFDHDMTITLKQELIINSFKTIDGRGANVHVAGGAGFTIQYVNNVIVHGIHIHDTEITGNANVRSSPSHFGWRTMADGDAISIFDSKNIWVDHCTLSNCKDGLVDAVEGSTAITISNNLFTNHNEVMLLGHSDAYTQDEVMRVTIAFNHFGEGLVQRMPRCRRGYFHVVNNDYTHYEMYAIGASAHATVLSQGNRFVAPDNNNAKEVTHLPDGNEGVNLRTSGDLMLNGAVFTEFGTTNPSSYERAVSLAAKSCHAIDTMTSGAGVLPCKLGQAC